MKNTEEIEIPEAYVERNLLVPTTSLLITMALGYGLYLLLKDVNPAGFLVLIPTGFFAFQTIWLFLNPFATVYKDRVEVKQSLFHNQQRFYIDLKKITEDKNGKLFITYKDEEVEKMNLFGIRKSGVQVLKQSVERHISTAGPIGTK